VQDNWLYFVGVVLVLHTYDAGLLLNRGFRFPGGFLVILLTFVAPICWIAGFFVGPWWAPLAAIPIVVIFGTIKLLLIDAVFRGTSDVVPMVRFYTALLLGYVGVACIGKWFY
jgi:hypothetical protein